MDVASQVTKLIGCVESFKVSKACQIWEQILQFPNVTLSFSISEQLVGWILEVFKETDHLIFPDVLSFLSVAVNLKEVKQAKVNFFSQLINLNSNNWQYI